MCAFLSTQAHVRADEAHLLDSQAVFDQTVTDLNEDYALVVVRDTAARPRPFVGWPNARIEELELTAR